MGWLVSGGITFQGLPLSDVWKFEFATMRWREISREDWKTFDGIPCVMPAADSVGIAYGDYVYYVSPAAGKRPSISRGLVQQLKHEDELCDHDVQSTTV